MWAGRPRRLTASHQGHEGREEEKKQEYHRWTGEYPKKSHPTGHQSKKQEHEPAGEEPRRAIS